jgi:uncharacterized damage-inducible protein DinB
MNLWSNMFRHHRWSNLVLIDFLSRLPDDQLALTVPGTYGNSLDTMRHIVSADADYVRIIPGTRDVPQVSDQGPFGGWEDLRTISETADDALVDFVDGLVDDEFFVDIDDRREFELSRSILLTQVIHHATEHRSQIRTTLSTHGITPLEIAVWDWRISEEGQSVLASLKRGM